MPDVLDSEILHRPNAGGQQGFMDDYQHRYCAMAGGWFAGKTWAGARKHADLHLHNAFDVNGNATFCKSLAVAQTYSLAGSIIIPELEKTFGEMNLAYRFLRAVTEYCFVFPDLGTRKQPSKMMIRSADKPSSITGWSVGAVWGDEVARWKKSSDGNPLGDPILQCDGRLRDASGVNPDGTPRVRVLQFNMTTTHEGDATEFYRLFEEKPTPQHKLYRAGTFENPHAQEFGDTMSAQLTPELGKQYIAGDALSLRGGRIYPSFDVRNVDANLEIVGNLPLQISLDFNINPGMHCIVGQHMPARDANSTDLLTSVWEIHAEGMDVRTMVTVLRRLIDTQLGGWRWPILEVFGDPAGQSRWAGTGETQYDVLIAALRQAGIPFVLKVSPAAPYVADRVNAANCAMHAMDGRVRYRVHPRCVRLIEDYRSCKWKNGEIDKGDRLRSHACLVAGTLVETIDGPLPIEEVRSGMMVATRIGYRQVTRAWMSSPAANVLTLTTNDGRKLTGTDNHPIFVKDCGFVLLGEVRIDSMLECIQYPTASIEKATEKSLSGTRDSNTTDTLIPRIRQTGRISLVEPDSATLGCTSKSTATISVRRRKGITSTIRTAIPRTTIRAIWNCVWDLVTFAGTQALRGISQRFASIFPRPALPLPCGMDRQRAESGTSNRPSRQVSDIIRRNENVSIAASDMSANRERRRSNSVAGTARPPLVALLASTTKCEPALLAESHSSAIGIGKTSHAPVCVAGVIAEIKTQPVYDLTVDEAHEFYANGILVSNSDADGYRIFRLLPIRTMSRGQDTSRVVVGPSF